MAALGSLLGMNSHELDSDTDFLSVLLGQNAGGDLPCFPDPPSQSEAPNPKASSITGLTSSCVPQEQFNNGGLVSHEKILLQQEPQDSTRLLGQTSGGFGVYGGYQGESGLGAPGFGSGGGVQWEPSFPGAMDKEHMEGGPMVESCGLGRCEDAVSVMRTEQLLRRQAAVQAKNRKAQKRFREKQKAKMASLEEEVATLKSQLDEMKVQNDTLSSQNGLLSKVLEFKDDQMAVLQEGAKVLSGGREEEVVDVVRWQEMLGLGNKQEAYEGSLPVSQFQNLNGDELKRVWKGYVQRLSQLLVAVGQSPNDEAKSRELDKVMQEIGEMMVKAANLCPVSMRKLVTTSCEGEIPGDRSKLFRQWSHVLDLMDLNPEQEALAITLRQTFVTKMKDTFEERGALNRAFQDCSQRTVDLGSTPDTCKASAEMQSIMESLKNSLHREAQYHTDFIGSFLRDVLTQEQRARTYVQSYPLYPDVLYISSIIAEKHASVMK